MPAGLRLVTIAPRMIFPKYFRSFDANDAQAQHRAHLALFSVGILGYAVFYLNYYALPTAANPQPNGWWGWFDQGEYYKTTVNLAHGQLQPSTYWYGYSALGALFYHILPLHPYLLPNLLCFCILLVSLHRALRTFCGGFEAVTLSLLLGTAQPFLIRDAFVIPWMTIPIQATFCLMTAWFVFERATMQRLAISAALSDLCLFCRPSDAPFLGLLYLIGIFSLPEWRRRILATMLLRPGETVTFGPYDRGAAALGYGWSHPDIDHHVWSDGSESTLKFRVDKSDLPMIYIPPRRHVHFSNHRHRGRWRKPLSDIWGLRSRSFERSVPLTAHDVDASGVVTIRLVHHTPRSPKSIGMNADTRSLPISLHELSLVPNRQ